MGHAGSLGAGVRNPGDFVVGHGNGVVIVPKDSVDSAVASALAREAKEAAMRESLEQGSTTAALLGLTDTMRRLGLD